MSTIDQVLTPDALHPESSDHTANGKFAPGNRAGVGFGRKKRAEEQAVLSAINEALPPDRLQQALSDALDWAYEYKSPKMVLALASFVVSYQIGSPIQRSMSASTRLEAILARVGTMSDEEFNAVEAEMRND